LDHRQIDTPIFTDLETQAAQNRAVILNGVPPAKWRAERSEGARRRTSDVSVFSDTASLRILVANQRRELEKPAQTSLVIPRDPSTAFRPHLTMAELRSG
jgi:hypothetical protein